MPRALSGAERPDELAAALVGPDASRDYAGFNMLCAYGLEWGGTSINREAGSAMEANAPRALDAPGEPNAGSAASGTGTRNPSACGSAATADRCLGADPAMERSLEVSPSLWHMSNRGGVAERLPPGLHAMSNGPMRDAWPKCRRGRVALEPLLKSLTARGAYRSKVSDPRNLAWRAFADWSHGRAASAGTDSIQRRSAVTREERREERGGGGLGMRGGRDCRGKEAGSCEALDPVRLNGCWSG